MDHRSLACWGWRCLVVEHVLSGCEALLPSQPLVLCTDALPVGLYSWIGFLSCIVFVVFPPVFYCFFLVETIPHQSCSIMQFTYSCNSFLLWNLLHFPFLVNVFYVKLKEKSSLPWQAFSFIYLFLCFIYISNLSRIGFYVGYDNIQFFFHSLVTLTSFEFQPVSGPFIGHLSFPYPLT